MREAIKATTVGEVVYQLGRIHSKLLEYIKYDEIIYNTVDSNNNPHFRIGLNNLMYTLDCLGNSNLKNSKLLAYKSQINVVIKFFDAKDKNNLRESLNTLNSDFATFVNNYKWAINNSCKNHYYDSCINFLLIETKIKSFYSDNE